MDVTSLVARDVVKDFAGIRALDGVSLSLERGEIHGLIGPNGSGKTTFINVVSGLLLITSGQVTVGGTNVTGWPAYRIARHGVARTFQVVRLFKEFSVLENVEVAAISATGVSRVEARRKAGELLERLGLSRLADAPAGALPQGEERRVEIARALAADPSFVLQDDPGAGLNDAEIEVLLPMLERIRQQFGCGILIVDHDMRLIMGLCDRITVLNYGKTIAEGSPLAVRSDPAVIEAYLGAEVA